MHCCDYVANAFFGRVWGTQRMRGQGALGAPSGRATYPVWAHGSELLCKVSRWQIFYMRSCYWCLS